MFYQLLNYDYALKTLKMYMSVMSEWRQQCQNLQNIY